MKLSMLFLPIIAALPLSAQDWEAGLFAGSQAYQSVDVIQGAGSINFKTNNKAVFAIRGGYEVMTAGPGVLQVTAAFQPKATAKTKAKNNANGTAASFDLATQSYSVGAMYNFKFKSQVFVGVGLDCRFEKLETTDASTSASTTWTRPWTRANVGYTFPMGTVKPFVGLELAIPLVSKGDKTNPTDNDLRRGLAPSGQIGLIAGVRF